LSQRATSVPDASRMRATSWRRGRSVTSHDSTTPSIWASAPLRAAAIGVSRVSSS